MKEWLVWISTHGLLYNYFLLVILLACSSISLHDMKQRIELIDLAKGFYFFLVVQIHVIGNSCYNLNGISQNSKLSRLKNFHMIHYDLSYFRHNYSL